jgi:hypothetical protein
MRGIRIRVLQFNGDEAGAQETLAHSAIRFSIVDAADRPAG